MYKRTLGVSDRPGGCHGTQVATGETGLLADEVMAGGLPLRGGYLLTKNGFCECGGRRIQKPNSRSAVKNSVIDL